MTSTREEREGGRRRGDGESSQPLLACLPVPSQTSAITHSLISAVMVTFPPPLCSPCSFVSLASRSSPHLSPNSQA